MTAPQLLTSKWCHWTTPQVVVDALTRFGDVALDPCSNLASIVPADRHLMRERGYDGLAHNWAETCAELGGIAFVNPPFGREIATWMRKVTMEAGRGCEIIALVPARVDARWFQEAIFDGAQQLCFVRGRLRFGNPPDGGEASTATFPTAIAYWGRRTTRFKNAFLPLGPVFDVGRAKQAELEVA